MASTKHFQEMLIGLTGRPESACSWALNKLSHGTNHIMPTDVSLQVS